MPVKEERIMLPEREKLVAPEDLTAVSREELHELKIRVDDSIGLIADQIKKANAEARTGHYADSDWYRRAHAALRFRKRDSQRIQAEFGRRKRMRRETDASENREFAEDFMEAAREVLDADRYAAVIQRTKDNRTTRTLTGGGD